MVSVVKASAMLHDQIMSSMDFSIQQLRMLREVAERGTIAAAADALGYTPSAVSQQLGALERGTGVEMLERVGRNVRLTDAGRELVRHAEDLLRGMEAAQTALEQVGSEPRGVLNIAVYESVASTMLPEMFRRANAAHPDLVLRTQQMDPDVAVDALALGDIDLAFTIDYAHAPAPKRPGIERELITEDRFRAVVPDDHRLTGPVVDLADLADEQFIAAPLDLSCGRCVAAACRAAGFEPDVAHQLDDYPTSMRLVAAGQGIGLMPDLALVHRIPGVRVVDLKQPVARHVELAYRTASAERPAITAMRDIIVAVGSETAERVRAA